MASKAYVPDIAVNRGLDRLLIISVQTLNNNQTA
jgi:hypothetical protein